MREGSKMRWRPGGGNLQGGNNKLTRPAPSPPMPALTSTSSSSSTSSAGGPHQRHFTNSPHYAGYVEDYGDMEAGKGVRNFGGGRFMSSGPLFCLWKFQRRVLSPHFVAAAAMVTSFLSMQFAADDSFLVTVANALTMALAMLILFQQRKIRKLGTLRTQQNELRRKASYFLQERERLHRTLDRMDEKLAQLHYVPQELHKWTKNSQQDVDRLSEIVQQTKAVHEAIRNKLRQKVLQQILGVVVNADKNSDWALTPQELERLTLRLGSLEGVEFNELKFSKVLSEDTSLHSILKIIRSLEERDDEYEHGDPVFKIKLDAMQHTGEITTAGRD